MFSSWKYSHYFELFKKNNANYVNKMQPVLLNISLLVFGSGLFPAYTIQATLLLSFTHKKSTVATSAYHKRLWACFSVKSL